MLESLGKILTNYIDNHETRNPTKLVKKNLFLINNELALSYNFDLIDHLWFEITGSL